jgi:predicted metal-dependent peptidase
MDPLQSMDAHIRSKSTKEDIQSDMMRAAMRCKNMPPGSIPSAVEDALGELMKPQLKFRDIVRNCMVRKSMDAGLKNDWTRCRKRYLAAKPSQYLPKRYSHKPRWVAMIDTSGSMTDDDIAYGISQLQVLGSNTDGFLVPCDAEVKWKEVTKIGNKNDLKKAKIVGRGGTVFDTFFEGLPEHLGTDFDVIVILTDGDCPFPDKKLRPRTDVCWVLTNGRHKTFKPSFGRVCPLRDERI